MGIKDAGSARPALRSDGVTGHKVLAQCRTQSRPSQCALAKPNHDSKSAFTHLILSKLKPHNSIGRSLAILEKSQTPSTVKTLDKLRQGSSAPSAIRKPAWGSLRETQRGSSPP
ncbi:Polyamine Deacetylase Hdac10 [Manis pentadactyla]|nr:Polyamine Deacetylase Hdac10 [Manis pentadactyla]